MDLTNILVWVIIGGVAGAIASYVVGQSSSILMDIIWGIVGALIGGAIVNLFGGNGVTGLNVYSLVVATLGAIVVLSVVKAMSGRSRDIYKS